MGGGARHDTVFIRSTPAATYHNNLQDIDTQQDSYTQKYQIIEATSYITAKLTTHEKGECSKKLNRLEIMMALASASNGKAAGLDGIPYEFWKVMCCYMHRPQAAIV